MGNRPSSREAVSSIGRDDQHWKHRNRRSHQWCPPIASRIEDAFVCTLQKSRPNTAAMRAGQVRHV